MSFTNILRYAFFQSDSVGKGIVIVLLAFSAGFWTICISKALAIIAKRRECHKFNRFYEKVGSPLAMGIYLGDLAGPLCNICRAGIDTLCEVLDIEERRRSSFLRNAVLPRRLNNAEIEKIRTRMNQQFNRESRELENDLGWLSIFITVSPFLGLFGTVWGVMATFIAIAQTSSIEISAIAPGISGALLTTVAGLTVAIPAVIANTAINSQINDRIQEMETFIDDFLASMQLEDSSSKADTEEQ